MRKGKKQTGTLLSIPINPHDLKALEDILHGYSAYLRNNGPVTPKMTQKIQRLEDIRGRIVFLRQGGEGVAATVSRDEIQTICEAMFAFVKIIRRTVPQSFTRDDTLRRVNLLRKSLQEERSS